jgi:REP element-mobilizing transposase RayT
MPYDPERHHRRAMRIAGYDYAQPGWYFVTLCTQPREPLFGTLTQGKMQLSPAGDIVLDEWLLTDMVRNNVILDEFFIMPDHLHGIIVLTTADPDRAPSVGRVGRGSLGSIIAQFKGQTTKQINALRGSPGAPVWQSSYYDHVIRDERDLERIRTYIANNRWQENDTGEPPIW